ncbi:immunoglobulin superfamily member 6 isoform X2 [Puntigrus tetrazona]|uniref:immunoglobulin superfamily member 6 isoform X2 n=1 Tax=Puntigrus tetrazona TaxID=1606681 RepID=UPI001C8950B3|nr:immunoglobulin superfamily member 6 isoform X2 [Puntigrus tetrazona]
MNFGFLFTYASLVFGIVGGCKIDVQQPRKLIRKKEQLSVSIPCSVTMSSCSKRDPPQISWYVFKKDSHYQLDLRSPSGRYTLGHEGLTISSLSEEDSGVYYCAAALLSLAQSGAQAIGQGTALKVSERGLNGAQALLLTLLVLLIVYSLLVLGIIVCIKTGRFKSVFKRRRNKSESKEVSARQVIFSGVVQELSKRNLVGDKMQTAKLLRNKRLRLIPLSQMLIYWSWEWVLQ